jgi:hypothetical protein
MKKTFIILFLSIFFCNQGFAESFYFKDCRISNAVKANYTINIEKNVIEVELFAIDGNTQSFTDKINKIEKDKITSEKIISAKGEDAYYQYFLQSKSKSVIKLQYKREAGSDISLFNLYEKKESFCTDVKSDWNRKAIEKAQIKKEQQDILKEQEKIRTEQSSLFECQGNEYKEWTNCRGSYKAESGYVYNGLFIDGKILKGFAIYPGGARYVGEFYNFQPSGYGTFVATDGEKYFGEWKNGKNHGGGTKEWSDGRRYVGQFKKDKLHGRGTLFYPNGEKYDGDFLNGYRHGKGTFSYPDGTAYIGEFAEGKETGLGECVSKDLSSVPCKNRADTQTKNFKGKDTLKISIVSKKWVRISQYETNTKKGKKIMDQLKNDFKVKALELCAVKGSYKVLEERIRVLEIDETPAYGLEAKLQLGIDGVIECA